MRRAKQGTAIRGLVDLDLLIEGVPILVPEVAALAAEPLILLVLEG